MGRPIPGNEEKPKLKIPEYLTRRSEEQSSESIQMKDMEEEPVEEYRKPVILKGETVESCLKEQPASLFHEVSLEGAAVKVTCNMEGKKVRKRHKQCDPEDTFSDMLSPSQVVRGMAWSMILGPRGGLHPKR
jgi:tRNA(Ser,Leu) C12 N-acetylase TAN1